MARAIASAFPGSVKFPGAALPGWPLRAPPRWAFPPPSPPETRCRIPPEHWAGKKYRTRCIRGPVAPKETSPSHSTIGSNSSAPPDCAKFLPLRTAAHDTHAQLRNSAAQFRRGPQQHVEPLAPIETAHREYGEVARIGLSRMRRQCLPPASPDRAIRVRCWTLARRKTPRCDRPHTGWWSSRNSPAVRALLPAWLECPS